MSRIEKLEEQLEAGKLAIKRGEAVERLLRNADFQEVIIRHFSTDDCARYARESVDPALTPDARASALAFAQAAGYLKQWLMIQLRFADTAKSEREYLDQAIEECRAEDIQADQSGAE